VGAAAALLLVTLAAVGSGTRHTGGRLVYPIDDPYIHMTIARNLALHGSWGITPGHFGPASSSPLWTLLLAATHRLVGGRDATPLVLNLMFGVLIAFGYDFFGPNLLLLPLAVLALVMFMTAMSLLLAAANVYLRDVQHLIEVFLLFWFWLTPIVYPINFAFDVLSKRHVFGVKLSTIYMLNPMANVVIGFQRAIYKHLVVLDSGGNPVKTLYQASVGTYVGRLGAVVAFSALLLWFAQRVFARAQGNFAQEL